MSSSSAVEYKWTPNSQGTAFAYTLRNLRRTIAHMLHDDSEQRNIAARALQGLEIDELHSYLKELKVDWNLVDSIERIRGDLNQMIKLIHDHRSPGFDGKI